MNDRKRVCFRSARTAAHRRRGTITVLVLVCLLVVVSLVGTLLQSAVRARRQLQTERNFRQAELLLQSGVERAVYRLSAEKDYRGEAWEPASQALAGPGRVVIQTQPAADNGPLQINVVAEYPVGSPLSIRRSYSFQFTPSHSRVEE